MTTIIISYLVFHILCGVLTYGITFGHFQRKWPSLAEEGKSGDRSFAFSIAAYGPIGLFASLTLSDFAKHGLKFK